VPLCSACSTDQSSCSCCVMVQKTNRLRTHFDTTLTELENEFVKANQSLHNIKGGWCIHRLQGGRRGLEKFPSCIDFLVLMRDHLSCFYSPNLFLFAFSASRAHLKQKASCCDVFVWTATVEKDLIKSSALSPDLHIFMCSCVKMA